MRLLAIETSCDETSVAVLEDGHTVLSNVVASQIKRHRKYGGVVPELASRLHCETINPLVDTALETSQTKLSEIGAIAVTQGPGLEGSLLVGLSAAKTMAGLLDIPIVGVNHLHGHIYANFLLDPPPPFPFICLIVSGGHTILLKVVDHFKFEVMGATRDDAAGEAFDKIGRFLELGYPGGPIVEKLARDGDPTAFNLPRPMKGKGLDFSFSGLKTAAIQLIKSLDAAGTAYRKEDICASFQQAIIDTLVTKSIRACLDTDIHHLCLSGGVTANRTLRDAFTVAAKPEGIQVYVPEFSLCTDNAGMIGVAGHYQLELDLGGLNGPLMANPNLKL